MNASMDEARLWRPLKDDTVHCRLCAHYCVIAESDRGRCGVRVNSKGKLYTLVRNSVAALHLDPVEKKPLYHFFPGTMTLSLGTMGCNLTCSFCQNFTLSMPPKEGKPIQGEQIGAEDIVALAFRSKAASIAYTYSEPTVFFELTEDIAKQAHAQALGNIIVSNGFQSQECLEAWGPMIDAANIDLKAFTERFYRDVCGARLKPVLDNLKTIRGMGWWLEVTTLVIPGLNDDPGELRAMADFIHRELGPQTPWHLSRFHPDNTMLDRPPTPPQTLKRAWEIGREAGLDYVYVGNITAVAGEGTECPRCSKVLLWRHGFQVRNIGMDKGACRACGATVAGLGMEAIPLEVR